MTTTLPSVRPLVVYIGVFLDVQSKETLLRLVPPKHPRVFADHCTLVFKPTLTDLKAFAFGSTHEFRAIGVAHDEKGQAVLVADVISKNALPHITISCADGVKPVYSNELLERGKVEFFDEPIPLVGVIDGYPRNLTLATGEPNG